MTTLYRRSGRAVGLVEYELLSPVKMELIARSIELWHAMPERVGGDIGYAGPGLVSLYREEGPAEAAAAWLKDVQGQPGVDARMITEKEINALDPELGSGWHSALYQANGAAIEPCLAAPAIARAARAKGAKLLQSCAVRSIERQGGAVSGVITEQGSIKTSSVIIAGGVWSSMLAAHLGLELPQIMIFAEQCSVGPVGAGMLYGLTMSAAAGEALADMVTGETPKFDVSPYRYERFTDGSEFVFHP